MYTRAETDKASFLLDESFVSRVIDKSFINDLSQDVDIGDDNGGYPSFVFDESTFRKAV